MKRTPQAKSQAAILVREMAAAGTPIKHQQALEMVAKMAGFRDWNAMAAAPDAVAPVVTPVATIVPAQNVGNPADGLALRKLIRLATDVSDFSDTTGCGDDLTVTSDSAISEMMEFIKKLESPMYASNPAASFDPTSQIMVTWSLHDVLSIRPDLTEAEAFDVLHYAKRKHDAEQGITWDVLRDNASWLFRERKLECTVKFRDAYGADVVKEALVELMHNGRVTIGGQSLNALAPCGHATAVFSSLPYGEDEFPIRFGRLFGQEDENDDEDGNGKYKRLEATRELMNLLMSEGDLPSVSMD